MFLDVPPLCELPKFPFQEVQDDPGERWVYILAFYGLYPFLDVSAADIIALPLHFFEIRPIRFSPSV